MSDEPIQTELLNRAFHQLGASVGASEGHGVLAGLLCARGRVDRETWFEEIEVRKPEAADILGQEAVQMLETLYTQTVGQLSSPMLDFQPVLPEDSAALQLRTQALGEWCEGFLSGLGFGGIKEEELPEDSAELLQDFAQLAHVGDYALESGEEDEVAYVELVEYVRTGVLLVNEELNPSKAPPQGGTLH